MSSIHPLVSTCGHPIPRDSRPIVLAQITGLGGAERACMALARWLHQHHLPAHFVTYSDTASLPDLATYPLELVELRPTMRAIPKIRSLHRHFDSLRPTFVPLISGYQSALHATLAQLPIFHTLMHDTPSLFSDKGLPAEPHRRVLRALSDHITSRGLHRGGTTMVTSQYLRDETERVFGINPVIVRMGGAGSPAGFRPRPAGPKLNLFSVSRIESSKRIDWMLRALAALQAGPIPLSTTVDWHLHLAGTGSLIESMRRLVATLGLAHRVHFHGFVSDAELARLYDQADLFLIPAVQGYGIPAIEALQRGIPVLIHRDSGVSDILLNTPWATVFSGGEDQMVPALRQAIRSVRHNLQLAQPLPALPSEDSWAEEVATRCGWL